MPGINRWPLICFLLLMVTPVLAQQYNSDSWIAKPHGTVTIIPTMGQRSSMIMNTFSLFPKWEFTYAAYIYNKDNDLLTEDGHSSAFFAKYMFHQNQTRNGGASVKFGTGLFPGTIKREEEKNDAFNTYWVNFPMTIPFFNNSLSLDLMPGGSITKTYENSENALAFTYSTRLAWYPTKPTWAIVGEIFGAEGERDSIPEYKIGWRWEPNQYVTFAVTYGEEIHGTEGAGFEIGMMMFTPQFACIGPCKKY